MPTHPPGQTACSDWTLPAEAHLLRIEGADALAFAQAQFASDLRELVIGRWQWSAWLDAQGRVRALLQLARSDEQTLIALLRGGSGDALAQDLRRYVLRARVRITPQRAWLHARPLASGGGGSALLQATRLRLDAGSHVLDLDLAADREPDPGPDDRNAAALAVVRAGHPWLPEVARGTLLPPALSLLRLQAVSLGKGCYPGQELVARLHYRGGHKRRLARVRLAAPQPPGSLAIMAGQAALLLNGASDGREWEALAVLSEPPSTAAITVQGIVLEVFPA
ncbi:MAG: folate-binding protein [Xanthomonadaceae bacterium]|nr:folate-binding protein [Xanthomonadaceae bacterium]MDE2246915.1 folate-binding protein [Xanthomonadaceae bacterium]